MFTFKTIKRGQRYILITEKWIKRLNQFYTQVSSSLWSYFQFILKCLKERFLKVYSQGSFNISKDQLLEEIVLKLSDNRNNWNYKVLVSKSKGKNLYSQGWNFINLRNI